MKGNKICKVFVVLAVLGLAACGGGGGDGGDGRPSSKLFVLDSGNLAIGSMINSNPSVGTLAVDRIVVGPATGLGTGTGGPGTLPDMVLDAAGDRLYVATQANVLVWDNAGFADGNRPRSRVMTSQVTRGTQVWAVNFSSLFIDTGNNQLYVGENIGDIHVYNNASTASGLRAPTRSITPDFGTATVVSSFGIAVDVPRDMLYAGFNPGGSRILVFHGQAALDTTGGSPRAPDRTILVPGADSFYLDATNNRLYVAQSGGVVQVFDDASTLDGAEAANRTFTLGNSQKYIFVDVANDRLYGVSENLVYIVPNASTADGPGVTATLLAVQTTNSHFGSVAVKP